MEASKRKLVTDVPFKDVVSAGIFTKKTGTTRLDKRHDIAALDQLKC